MDQERCKKHGMVVSWCSLCLREKQRRALGVKYVAPPPSEEDGAEDGPTEEIPERRGWGDTPYRDEDGYLDPAEAPFATRRPPRVTEEEDEEDEPKSERPALDAARDAAKESRGDGHQRSRTLLPRGTCSICHEQKKTPYTTESGEPLCSTCYQRQRRANKATLPA